MVAAAEREGIEPRLVHQAEEAPQSPQLLLTGSRITPSPLAVGAMEQLPLLERNLLDQMALILCWRPLPQRAAGAAAGSPKTEAPVVLAAVNLMELELLGLELQTKVTEAATEFITSVLIFSRLGAVAAQGKSVEARLEAPLELVETVWPHRLLDRLLPVAAGAEAGFQPEEFTLGAKSLVAEERVAAERDRLGQIRREVARPTPEAVEAEGDTTEALRLMEPAEMAVQELWWSNTQTLLPSPILAVA